MSRLAGALAVVAGLAAGGCATPPPAADADFAGRLWLQVAAHDGRAARSLGADFELRGSAREGSLALFTPLGTTLAQARWRPGEAELSSGDGVDRFADLDDLAQRMLGEALPLVALFDWLRARPWPAAPSVATARGFEQLGWQVDVARHGEGWVVVERPRPPAVTLRVRLATAS